MKCKPHHPNVPLSTTRDQDSHVRLAECQTVCFSRRTKELET